MDKDRIVRCWGVDPVKDPIYCPYHDQEWGHPTHDDRLVQEQFVLELFQAGLSWLLLLKKRENFRRAFAGFDLEKIAQFDDAKIEELMQDEGIVRNRRKIEATVSNARIVVSDIIPEFGSLEAYLWHFTGGKSIIEPVSVTSDALSDDVSADMKRRGLRFVGTVTIFSFLQSLGIIYSHTPQCFCWARDHADAFVGNKYRRKRKAKKANKK